MPIAQLDRADVVAGSGALGGADAAMGSAEPDRWVRVDDTHYALPVTAQLMTVSLVTFTVSPGARVPSGFWPAARR